MFSSCFSQLSDDVKNKYETRILNYLKGSDVLERFNTLKVYEYLEDLYISKAKLSEYNKYIAFMKDPNPFFKKEVERRFEEVESHISSEDADFEEEMRKILQAFQNRV